MFIRGRIKHDPAQSAESWGISDPAQKITFAQMRAAGVRSVLVYCADFRCGHSTSLAADYWADNVRLSDIEPRFTCCLRLLRCGCSAREAAAPR